MLNNKQYYKTSASQGETKLLKGVGKGFGGEVHVEVEVEEWFTKYTSDLNGRPLIDGESKEEDKAKTDALSADEKAMLADLVSSATMSLNDSHGDIVGAIRASFANKKAIDISIE